MSYAQFLGLFLLPPLALLCWGAHATGRRSEPARKVVRSGLPVVGGLVVVAVIFTTPWDSWLIQRNVWGYNPGSVTGVLWRVPFEEYGFMAGQTAAVGLWTLLVAASRLGRTPVSAPAGRVPSRWRLVTTVGWAGAGVAGVVCVAVWPHALYLGAILAWAAIPLAVQCCVGADLLWARRMAWAVAIAVPVLYLWAVDRLAISRGVWHIAAEHTIGARPWGLPVEEAVFFLVTTALVVNGVLLGIDPAARARLVNAANRAIPGRMPVRVRG